MTDRKGSKITGARNSNMRIITVCLPIKWIKTINEMVQKGEFANFSEAIRFMVKNFLDFHWID